MNPFSPVNHMRCVHRRGECVCANRYISQLSYGNSVRTKRCNTNVVNDLLLLSCSWLSLLLYQIHKELINVMDG